MTFVRSSRTDHFVAGVIVTVLVMSVFRGATLWFCVLGLVTALAWLFEPVENDTMEKSD